MRVEREGVLREVRSALEALGFTVVGGAARGFSGYLHRFDFNAEREGRRLYISVASSPEGLLMELAKSLDVDGEVVAVYLGEPPSAPESGNLKLVSAGSFGELRSKLIGALAQRKE